MGAWVAVTGSFWLRSDLPAWLLLAALTVWIGGFDLIYACQDVDVDREQGLHSFPARFGIAVALQLARGCHLVTVALLAAVGVWFGLGWPFWVGLLLVAALFIWEHTLVRPEDLSRVDIAFFNINGYISVTVLASVLAGLWMA
jgi:4-hydroxybenzoate polyprenyltransferase